MSVASLWPRTPLHWASACLLWGVFLAYLLVWTRGSTELLLDPLIQADDVRTYLFPFHRWDAGGFPVADPSAAEMLLYTPPLVRALYVALVPWLGLFAAAKIVQAVCFLVVLLAGGVLLRARRAGLASAVLLVFLFLHTGFCVNRTVGGLPRSFAFPAVALWVAGALGGSDLARVGALLLAAAIYPVAMSILLVAEGAYALRAGLRWTRALRARSGRTVAVAVACALVVGAFLLAATHGDRVHTAAEASREPAFGRNGRLSAPLTGGGADLARAMIAPFASPPPREEASPVALAFATAAPLVLVAGLVLLPSLRLSPPPIAAVALLIGTVVVYALSIAFAFRLYAPDRYVAYGGTAVAWALPVSSIGLLFPRWSRPTRTVARNLAAAAFIAVVLVLTGGGVIPRNGLDLDGRTNARLYEFARTLPVESRIAAHPLDGDDLPFWAGRATVAGYETLQPWYVESWKRQKARTKQLLRALYATDRETVLRFAAAQGVTHFLLRIDRYGHDFAVRARLFEPFDRFTASLLAGASRGDLALARVPVDAVVYRDRRFLLVDVARLRASWSGARASD